MRICAVITARASYARIKTAMEAIARHPDLELQVVTAGSALLERYGCVADVMEREGFPSERVLSVVEGGTPEAMVKGTGNLMSELGTLFARTRPDAVVTIADRHETLATAVAASYQNIPLVHVQGGEVTGSIDDRVRNAVTQLANLHFVATPMAADMVDSQLKGDQGLVFVTGCPSIDLAARSAPLETLSAGSGATIDLSKPFLIVLYHSDTSEWDSAGLGAGAIFEALSYLSLPVVWFWPNVDAGTDRIAKIMRTYRVKAPMRYVRNLPPEQFAGLAKRAVCIVGNSSFGIREASFLGLPAVNIGDRQRGRERAGNVVDVGYEYGAIKSAIIEQSERRYEPSHLYGDGKAGERIAEYLAEELGRRRAA